MQIINFFLLALLALSVVLLSVFFVLLIQKNVRQGRVARQQLAQRVEGLRMSRMLKALGLDFDKYLHQVPTYRISQSMDKCESCPTTDQCDEKLKQDTIKADELGFCPNQDCLGKHVDLNQKAAS